MTINEQVRELVERLRAGIFTSEAAVSQGIVLPTLQALGWPVFDTSVVIPEYSVVGRRVDYALCHPKNRPSVFIEVKKVGLSEGADKQLFEYAFHQGVPMAILTDGQEWSFYLPAEQGRYDERRVYKLDLVERETQEACYRLSRYLNYENVCSGSALDSARRDYKDVSKIRTVTRNIPIAWEILLNEQDSLLLEMLSDKVEDICGYKPSLDECGKYISEISQNRNAKPFVASKLDSTGKENIRSKRNHQGNGVFYFEFNGDKKLASSAREVMTITFQTLYENDNSFFERFAARKHGKKRRYLSNSMYELYPGRADLVESHSIEVARGWWLGTNYSRRDISKIIALAIEVYGMNNNDRIYFAV